MVRRGAIGRAAVSLGLAVLACGKIESEDVPATQGTVDPVRFKAARTLLAGHDDGAC